MTRPHIVLFGHFGVGNLGNDTSLEAAVVNIRRFLPSATITCVCRSSRLIAERFGIAALPMDVNDDRQHGGELRRHRTIVGKLLARIGDELSFWVNRTRWFRTVDHFMVVGTGAIYDATSPPWNVPYDLFKWCRAARLGGSRVAFVSVGAGPIVHPVSRVLMLNALRIAHYRSFRDKASFDYLRSVGYDTAGDHLFPDLVFSLPLPPCEPPELAGAGPYRVGVGVMAYYGPAHDTTAGEPLYREYVERMTRFVLWLLSQGHRVRLLTGDIDNDPQPAHEIRNAVHAAANADWVDRLAWERILSVNDLSHQIAQTDIVIASRFHNLVGALMAGRPVMSVGFHEKNDALMADMGLQEYCQHIERIDVERLVTQFGTLVHNRESIASRIADVTARYRVRLDEQFRTLLAGEGTAPGSAVAASPSAPSHS